MSIVLAGLWHLSFTVRDLGRSVEFYRGQLGLELIHEQEQANEYTRRLTGYPDAHLRVAMLRIPGAPVGPSGHHVELVEYVAPQGRPADVATKNSGSAEPSGEVVAAGAEVRSVAVGDRVAVHHSIGCGTCPTCVQGRDNLCRSLRQLGVHQWGGLAEIVNVPSRNVMKLHDAVRSTDAAVISCAIGTAVHALRDCGRPEPGALVVIIGAGGLGVHAIQVAALDSCEVIALDVSEDKLAYAKAAGANWAMDSRAPEVEQRILEISHGSGVPLALDFVGIPQTLGISLRTLAKGGRLVLVGYAPGAQLNVAVPDVVLRELSILGARTSTASAFRDAVHLVNAGRVRPAVTDVVSLDGVNGALERLRQGRVLGRVVVDINGGTEMHHRLGMARVSAG